MPSFENPAAFLLILLIPLLYILRHLKILAKISFPAVLADWEGRSFTWKGHTQKFLSVLSQILLIAGFLISIAAFADPVISSQEKVYTSLGTDIVFVLDTSPSMSAKDMDGGMRLEAAKNAILKLTKENDASRYGLVALGSNAAVLVPPTTDHSFFTEHLINISAGSFGNGSAIGDGLSTAVCHLVSSTAPKKCIVLLTDGENNAGEIHPETAARLAADNEITIYVVGIGSKGRVPIEYTDPATGKIYSGHLDSNFNPASLKKISTIGNGRYFEAQSLDELSATLGTVTKIETVTPNYTYRTVSNYYYKNFLTLAIIILVITWFIKRIILKEMICFRHKRILLVRSAFLAVSFVMLLIARSGISWGSYLVPVQKNGHSVAMVFDISNSMLARDCPGTGAHGSSTRLEAASVYAKKLISRMEGVSVAIILAKGDGVAAIPLTDDVAMTESLLSVMSPSLMTVPGTSLGKGILKARGAFPANHASAGRIWVFTDGEETDGQLVPALNECQKSGIPVTIIGFGKEEESPVMAGDGKTQVMTALRRSHLESAVSEASKKYSFFKGHSAPTYISAEEKGSAISLLSQLNSAGAESMITAYEMKPVPRYKLFLALAVISFILSYVLTEFNFARFFHTSPKQAAVALSVFTILFSSCSSDTAEILKGTISYHKKQYRHSVSRFMKASENSTAHNNEQNMSYAIYDLATAYIMLGETDEAMELFTSIADNSESVPDEVRYAACYNAGVIAHRNSDFEEAQNFFKKALQIDNSKIEAKINLELSMQMAEGRGHQNESNAIQSTQDDQTPQNLEKAVFEHIKENDQKQWKNSESQQSTNLAEDF